jgi:hypothetical protein
MLIMRAVRRSGDWHATIGIMTADVLPTAEATS